MVPVGWVVVPIVRVETGIVRLVRRPISRTSNLRSKCHYPFERLNQTHRKTRYPPVDLSLNLFIESCANLNQQP